MTISKVFTKELKNFREYIVLAKVKAKDYQNTNLRIIKHLTTKENIPGVYVTLNKPYEHLATLFDKSKISRDMIIFIDAVTKTIGGKVKKTKDCLFIGNPENLSDISLAMDQAVRALPGTEKFVFFDSLSTLLVYNDANSVVRFIHFLAGKMRLWKVRGIIISLQKDSDKEFIDLLNQVCDLTVDLGGKK
jgi:archaellum biogenesis ATPase FlaH